MNKILNFGSLNLDYTYNVGHFVKAGETLSANALRAKCSQKPTLTRRRKNSAVNFT